MEYMDREYEKKRENSSEGLFHQYQPQEREEGMRGLLQVRQEQNEEGRMQEIFRMGNAFGNVSLGANQKGEYTLLVNKEKNWQGPSMQREQRELNQQRCSVWNSWAGKLQLNSEKDRVGAAAFHTRDRGIRPVQMLQEMEKLSRRQGQETLRELLPFHESGGTGQGEKQQSSQKASLWNTMNRGLRRAVLKHEGKGRKAFLEKFF
ncbi:MAG: hypothetical protein J1F02_01815 [Lachnospiraceae bacterium]|nr:hypothetical protein [Lachnospiraceae bacterium]